LIQKKFWGSLVKKVTVVTLIFNKIDIYVYIGDIGVYIIGDNRKLLLPLPLAVTTRASTGL